MTAVASVERELRASVAAEIAAPTAAYLSDETEARGLRGRADAVALPRSAEEVAEVVAWCYAHGVAIVPRGGGTGYAAGAVPIDGGVVLALERLDRVRSIEPLLWRMHVEAGLRTSEVRRLAREGGLLFPPDPGAAEQSQIGGNIATNAGGPHAYKYGVTGAWITGLEVVVAPGEVVQLGGPLTKDVAGYDLKRLLIGSEGTLGVNAPETAAEIAALWRWRDGLSLVVGAQRGGKAGEDIAVPLDRLAEAIEESLEIGKRLGLPACSWGHAGNGNLHTTFLLAADDERELTLAARASEELFELALRLGGTLSGEHGIGFIKRNWLERQLGPRAFELHAAVKRAFDPENLLNPGKKA